MYMYVHVQKCVQSASSLPYIQSGAWIYVRSREYGQVLETCHVHKKKKTPLCRDDLWLNSGLYLACAASRSLYIAVSTVSTVSTASTASTASTHCQHCISLLTTPAKAPYDDESAS